MTNAYQMGDTDSLHIAQSGSTAHQDWQHWGRTRSLPPDICIFCIPSLNVKMLIFWGQPNGLSLLVFWGKNHLHSVGFRRNHSLKEQNIWCKTYSKMMGCTLLYTFTLFAKLIERTEWIWVGCAGIAITTCKSYYHHLMLSFCHY